MEDYECGTFGGAYAFGVKGLRMLGVSEVCSAFDRVLGFAGATNMVRWFTAT